MDERGSLTALWLRKLGYSNKAFVSWDSNIFIDEGEADKLTFFANVGEVG